MQKQVRLSDEARDAIRQMKRDTGLSYIELTNRAINHFIKSRDYIKLLSAEKARELRLAKKNKDKDKES